MKATLFILLILTCSFAMAQRPSSDAIKTSKGELLIQPISHATLALTWNNKTIYVDPTGGEKAFEGLPVPDLILITDMHGDHLDVKTVTEAIEPHTILVVPQAVADKLPDSLKSKAVVINNGQTISKIDITITAIPMYNLPASPDAMHTKGRGNGYVITFGDKTLYLSGDTAGIPEMRALKNIDMAFVSMNLPYTMDILEAASAVLDFKPKIVYPYHYRGKNGISDTEAFKKLVHDKNPSIDVRLRDWYAD